MDDRTEQMQMQMSIGFWDDILTTQAIVMGQLSQSQRLEIVDVEFNFDDEAVTIVADILTEQVN